MIQTGFGQHLFRLSGLFKFRNIGEVFDPFDHLSLEIVSGFYNSPKLLSMKGFRPTEVNFLFQESYERAKLILKNHQKEHKLLAEALLKYETLDADDIKAIMSGKKEPEKDLASRKEPQKKEPTSTTS